jgi:GT2 family glycosyltransferase
MPIVSIVISTWNSGEVLPQCLNSLAKQTVKDFEVIIVDNGSSDNSIDDLPGKWPALDFHIRKLDKNTGFAAANNLGAQLARGAWLALLNSDAFPDPEWLENLLNTATREPNFSFFASRQLQAGAPHLIDGAGDAYHISGLAWRRYAGFPADQFGLESEEVFSACAAAALYSRQAFLQVGGFDESFFSYLEDVDLGFRLRLQGFRCLYVPEAIVYHVGSATLGVRSKFAYYHWQRNFIWLFSQNMPAGLLWLALPAHLVANIIYQLYHMFRGRGGILLKGKLDALQGLPGVLRKRREIQKARKISNRELFLVMERGFLQPYLLGYNIRKVNHARRSSSKVP